MTDLERIHFIEETFGFKLHQVPIEKLGTEKKFYTVSLRYFSLLDIEDDNFYYKGTRNYSIDSNGNVIGLALDFSPVFLLPKNYLLGFRFLEQLRLKNVFLSDVSFLKELKGITSLDLSSNYLSDVSFLEELKGITSLDLSSNKLSDVSILKELKDITSLDLSGNKGITDYSFLKELKDITSLYLSSNNLSDVSFLKELKGITSLELSSNNLSDVSFLKKLKGITSLDLSGNSLSDVSSLKELKGITSLDLSFNSLSDVSFLKKLNGITSLGLSSNSLSDVSSLKELKGITSLDLSNNSLSNLSSLKELQGITSLYLSNNSLSDLSLLKELKGITSLGLSSNSLSDVSFLKELKGITSLYLRNNKLSDVSFLKELKGITSLDLSGNSLSDVSFLKKLKGITSLYLGGNSLSDVSSLKELKGIISLDLSSNSLSDVSSLKELKGITSLDLSSNSLSDVSSLKELKGITSLDLSSNKLSDVSSLKELKGITSLDLGGNSLSDVSSLKELKGITSLDLRNNKLSDVSSLKELKGITSLYLSSNSLSDVSSLKELKGTTSLDLRNNKLSDVSFLKELKGITSLDLRNNKLSDVSSLKELKGITSLHLSGNSLSDVSFLKELKGITSLYLGENPIVIPPKEIAEKGIEAIHDYFRQHQEQGEDYIYESKMLILGEGEAGKTTMVRKIKDPNCSLPKKDETTRGIDVVKWLFPHNCIKQNKKVEFNINIWDFGGQDIYHATHRFFLSERSLYVIVADTRQDNTDFFYWLHICEQFGGESPMVIVLNEKFERTRSIDYNTLRGQFPGLKEKVHVNFADNRGLTDLISKVKHYITNQQHIGQPIPAGWVKVRKAVEELTENSITRKDYLRICNESQVSDSDSELLSQYFHDIGVFLHFIGDDILCDTVFLKSAWVTNAVFKIIDCPELNRNNGHFNRALVEKLLAGNEYTGMHGKILQMMKNFGLIFEIDSKRKYVSPQHLNDNKPDYVRLNNTISVRYEYEIFMPKGIVNRLTVVMHDLISSLDHIWKNGVVLKLKEARAEVIESYSKREIVINAEGTFKRDLMTLIVQNIDKINESYKKLHVNKFIPCNCEECISLKNPHEFKYDTLQHFIMSHQSEIQCQKSFKMVDVGGLMDEVVTRDFQNKTREKMKESTKKTKEEPVQNGVGIKSTLIALFAFCVVVAVILIVALVLNSNGVGIWWMIAIIIFVILAFPSIWTYAVSPGQISEKGALSSFSQIMKSLSILQLLRRKSS